MASPIYNTNETRIPFGPKTPRGPIQEGPSITPPRQSRSININKIYQQVLQGVASSIAGYEQNFSAEEENAYVIVNYNITTPSGVQQQFEWLLTKGQTSVRPPEELASWTVLNPSLEDLTGITDDSFEIPTYKVPEIPAVTSPQPRIVTPPLISIDVEQLNPFTTPIIELPNVPRVDIPTQIVVGDKTFEITPLPLDMVGGSPVSGEGGRENPQLGSSSSRGGVLGGANYSNPQEAVDNEFRFRTRITDRER